MFILFWTEYLTQDTYIATLVGLMGAVLSLRVGKKARDDLRYEQVFIHYTAINGESQKMYMSSLLNNPRQINGVFIDDNVAYAVRCTLNGTSDDEVLRLVKSVRRYADTLCIYGNDVHYGKIRDISPVKIEVRPIKTLIEQLKSKGALPEIPQEFARAVRGEKPVGNLRRAGYLLLSAFLMVATAPFSSVKLYMLIWSSVLILLSVSVAFKRFESNTRNRT